MHSELANGARRKAATTTLLGLMTWLGDAGLAAIAVAPGLRAAVDQHAAAVRDALGDPDQGPGAVALAGYACGVRDAAVEHEWAIPDPTSLDWATADWPTLRLLAICVLARAQKLV